MPSQLDLQKYQLESIIKTIQEAQQKEEKRAFKLINAKSKKERNELEKRFIAERHIERNRIEQLKEEYDTIKVHLIEGTFKRDNIDNTKHTATTSLSHTTNDRFVGLQTTEDLIWQREVNKRFEKDTMTRNSYNNNNNSYNSNSESKAALPMDTKKLQLLREKRDVLTKLIQIQHKEYSETTKWNNNNTRRSYDWMNDKAENSTIASSTRSSTAASYATFNNGVSGSSTRISMSGERKVPQRVTTITNIPKLKL